MQAKPLRRPQSVHVFLVCQVEGVRSYLLLHRRAMPQLGLPAFWQGVTGALELGETFLEAGLREVWEETQIRLSSLIDTEFSHRFPIRREWREAYGEGPAEVEERVFYAVLPGPMLPVLSQEHQAWRWCLFGEAEQLLTFGANKDCLQAVERHITMLQTPNTGISDAPVS